jgi:hypothetical protein
LAGHVPTFDVDDFVAENAGDLGAGFCFLDESGKKENRSSGNGKGIKLVVLYDKKTVVEGLWPHGQQYALPKPVDIAFDLGIANELKLLARLAPKFSADPNFFVFARPAHGGKNVFGNLRGGAAATHRETNQ